MNLSEDQILALAPDDSSKKSGKDLANPSKWANTGVNEKALWGECQGSGKNPYRTQVDLSNIAFKCSCPSRKFPCKHGLGVLLLYARQKNLFSNGESPDWVKDWIDKREEKKEKQQEKADKPVDLEAQAKRVQQRLKKVNGGIDELQLVLKDIVRNGILNMPEKGPALFTNLTKRMVDSQASGLAVMTREVAEMNYFSDGWQTTFMDHLSRIHLVVSAFRKMEVLPDELAEEIKSQLGFTQSTDELKQQEGLNDQWLVLGKHTEQQEQLFVQRNWLLGTNSKKYALVLQFYVRTQPPELNLTPGTLIEAELSFYKSICPVRAIVKNLGKTSAPSDIKGFENWVQLLQFEKEQYSKSPFVTSMPFVINDVKFAGDGKRWFFNDRENKSVAVQCEDKKLHKLLAVSGGNSFSAVVVGGEGHYEPIAMYINKSFIIL
ncbi:MAG: zinc finger domain protein [Bacteroidetes bacterium]|jgi:hypothetical protein|nr:zinc finger domain protein [Bacteroidota bacterium]